MVTSGHPVVVLSVALVAVSVGLFPGCCGCEPAKQRSSKAVRKTMILPSAGAIRGRWPVSRCMSILQD
jgi:hypothetical protein